MMNFSRVGCKFHILHKYLNLNSNGCSSSYTSISVIYIRYKYISLSTVLYICSAIDEDKNN